MSCNSTIPSATSFENGMYIGINLQNILYGIELVLYFRTMEIHLARRRQPRKSDIFYATFSTVMLVLVTIWMTALSMLGQKMWLLDRNYPGGPMAYHTANSSGLHMVFGRFSLAILQQMTDALMIHRCCMVWGNRRVIVVPSILWLANFGLGMVLDWTSSMPGTTFFTGTAAKLGLAYYSSSTFLNVTLSSMICYRLLCHARKMKGHFGSRHASPYISIVALVVESVLPFTLSSVAFLISYGMGSQSAVVFSFVHPLVMCVSPQVLILRMAKREKEEITFPEPKGRVAQDHEDMPGLIYSDRNGVVVHRETIVHQQACHEDDGV